MSEWMIALTQGLCGMVVAEAFIGKKVGNAVWPWGFFLGVLPSLIEGIVGIFLSQGQMVYVENGLLRSVGFGLFLSWGASIFFVRKWRAHQVERGACVGWISVSWLVSGLVMVETIDGASILWPILPNRIGGALVAECDPVLCVWLAILLCRLFFVSAKPLAVVSGKRAYAKVKAGEPKKKPREQGTKKAESGKSKAKGGRKREPEKVKVGVGRGKRLAWGIGIAVGWVVFCGGMKYWGLSGFENDLAAKRVNYRRLIEAPVGMNLFFRRAVAEVGDELWVGYRSVWQRGSSPTRWTQYPRGKKELVGVSAVKEVATVMQATNGWWAAREHKKGVWIADFRHREVRVWGQKKGMVDSWFPRAWDILPESSIDHLQRVEAIREDKGEVWKRSISRTFGVEDRWEGNPRLAGITGKLPECLMVKE